MKIVIEIDDNGDTSTYMEVERGRLNISTCNIKEFKVNDKVNKVDIGMVGMTLSATGKNILAALDKPDLTLKATKLEDKISN